MSANNAFVLAAGIGIVAGLRTLTAPAAVSSLSGECLSAAASQSLSAGAVLGRIGGVVGAFGGYHARTRLEVVSKMVIFWQP